MKSIAVTLCAALVASALVAIETPAPEKPPNIGWLVRGSKLHDKVFVVKVRNEIPASAVPATYPNAIEIHWKYTPDSLGMPVDRVTLELAKFEAAVDPIQGDHIGYLMTIITGDGERTWLWYVADPKAFAAALNRLVPGHPFPITLNAVANEPDWKTYRAMREKVH